MISRWVTRAALIASGVVLALLLVEILVRVAGIAQPPDEPSNPYPRFYFRSDPARGFDLSENFAPADFALLDYRRAYNGFFKVWTNELGCFDQPLEPRRDFILLVGDSFTWGYAPLEQTWGMVLQSQIGTRVLKCGVGGYGTRQEKNKIEMIVHRAGNPRLVIIGYFIENDVLDDYLFPYSTVVDGYLVTKTEVDWLTGAKTTVAENEIRERLTAALRPKRTWMASIKALLVRHSVTYNTVRETRALRTIAHELGVAEPAAASSVPVVFGSLQSSPWLAGAWEEHFDNVREVKRLAARLGTRLLFVIIPTREQVYDFLRPPDVNAQWDVPNKRLTDFLQGEDIDFLDLLPELKKRARQTPKRLLEVDVDLYWPQDRHWNIRGNRLVGLLIGRYLLERGMINPSDRRDRLTHIERQLDGFSLPGDSAT
jgi:hypothetical protein